MRFVFIASVACLLVLAPVPGSIVDLGVETGYSASRERPFEGFGSDTPGGSAGTPYVVTSLADSGPGTFRDAVSSSNRDVSFAVSGTILLQNTLEIRNVHHLTIDGSTAGGTGITIRPAHGGVESCLVSIRDAHDVIFRHIRVDDAPDPDTGDNVRIWYNNYNIVIDHCSFRGAGDGNFDISNESHDITVQWCIIGDTAKNCLLRTDCYNLSLHHNLFVHGDERNPQVQEDTHVVDFVNNVIYNWAGNYGTRFRIGASGNIVGNYYAPGPSSDVSDAIIITGDSGPVYVSGNVVPPQSVNSGTTQTRHLAASVTEMEPQNALIAVLAEAGAEPRDSRDNGLVGDVEASSVEETSWGRIKATYR